MAQPRIEIPLIPEASPYWPEHVARYRFAVDHVTGRRTLDVACGDGYGLPILSSSASAVVGVDLDQRAAQNALRQLQGKSGQVVVADGCDLPFLDASFGAITSFETMEHLENREKFVVELSRILEPGGICILSTPNAKHTRPVNGRPKNPYHVHEYTHEELQLQLRRHFANVTLLGESLDPRFVIPPLWDEQEELSKRSGMRKHVFLWRALRRLPLLGVRDQLSRIMWGHAFLPSENDYHFSPTMDETVPVLIAICHTNVNS